MTSATSTLAPSAANRTAATFPIPLAAPVIKATFPSSLPMASRLPFSSRAVFGLPNLGVERRRGSPTFQRGDQVVRGQEPHGDPGVHGGAAQVRNDHGVLQLQQVGM